MRSTAHFVVAFLLLYIVYAVIRWCFSPVACDKNHRHATSLDGFACWFVRIGFRDFILAVLLLFQQVKPNAKCPACGGRNGVIRWSPAHKRVIHACNICQAAWGEKPIRNPELWAVKDLEEAIAQQMIERSQSTTEETSK